jgi:hypothetical protein
MPVELDVMNPAARLAPAIFARVVPKAAACDAIG